MPQILKSAGCFRSDKSGFFVRWRSIIFASGEGAVGRAFSRIGLIADHAVLYRQAAFRHLEAFRGQLNQDLPGFNPCHPQGWAEVSQAARPVGAAVPGTELRVAQHHADRAVGDFEFLSKHLRKGCNDPLSHFDFAGEAGNSSVFRDSEICVEVVRISAAAALLLHEWE